MDLQFTFAFFIMIPGRSFILFLDDDDNMTNHRNGTVALLFFLTTSVSNDTSAPS